DYLNELPARTHMSFEFGDPELIAKKVGGRHVVSGLYPMTMLKVGSKEECIDKAKELIDVLAPGGQYIFSLDKNLLKAKDINPDHLKAVLDFVKEYGKY
ncbi:MAG: uroporphyrinogen decarboxylase, partial [Eubacterium sp.]